MPSFEDPFPATMSNGGTGPASLGALAAGETQRLVAWTRLATEDPAPDDVPGLRPGGQEAGMGSLDERTLAIMDALGIAPSSKAASGRYIHADPLRPGVRYWAGHAHGQALFGVQFLAGGMGEAAQLGHALEAAGFLPREPAPKRLTYCRGAAFLVGGHLDVDALTVAKADLDRLLS